MIDSEQRGKELVALEATVYFREVYEARKDELEERPMVLGVGSGSTVAVFMARLIRKIGPLLTNKKFPFIQCVPTSRQAEDLILQHSHYEGKQYLHLSSLNAHTAVDLIVDGADEVCIRKDGVHMLKGGGGAMVMEMIVARASENRLYLVNKSKISGSGLGEKRVPVPVEVLPDAHRFVLAKIEDNVQGCGGTIRLAPGGKAGPIITDNGNMIIDLKFSGPFDPVAVSSALNEIPGVVGHGIFTICIQALIISDGTNVLKQTFSL